MDYKTFESTRMTKRSVRSVDEITTNDRYADANGTTIKGMLFESGSSGSPDYDETYYTQVYFELHEDSAWLSADNVCPPDGCAIYWDDFAWQPVNVGKDGFFGHTPTQKVFRTVNHMASTMGIGMHGVVE